MQKKTVNIILEFRFYIDELGKVYTDASFDHQFWKRYLMVFDEVNIIARAKPVNSAEVSSTWKMVTGDKVSFTAIPYYHGMGQLMKRLPTVVKAIKQIITSNNNPYILRMPSIIGVLFFAAGKKMTQVPYGVEMVGDPEEVFAALPFIYKPLAGSFVKRTRSIIGRAKAVAYVERAVLPHKYPAASAVHPYYFSSINLPDNSIVNKPKKAEAGKTFRILSMGMLDQMYKGPDILLEALALCKQNGMKLKLTWLGGGANLEKVKEMAHSMGLGNEAAFKGTLTERQAIEDEMDNADLFVLASRTEGLPRAMIESMARGLPCIGSKVGGIPELLQDEYLFEKENAKQLAELIMKTAKDDAQLLSMSEENIETARRYTNTRLDKERLGFYNSVLKASE